MLQTGNKFLKNESFGTKVLKLPVDSLRDYESEYNQWQRECIVQKQDCDQASQAADGQRRWNKK